MKTFQEYLNENKTQELVLIRGVPGSGKSTLAKKLGYAHFEADMYFELKGKYTFDASKLQEAHKWCQNEVYKTLKAGKSCVVSNTFVKRWEMQPYLDMAKKENIPVRIIEATGNYKNVHGVPDEVIANMKQRWETVKLN